MTKSYEEYIDWDAHDRYLAELDGAEADSNNGDIKQMLSQWAEYQKAADDLAAQIRALVLMDGDSVEIEGAKAQYYNKPTRYDYAAAAEHADVPAELLEEHTKQKVDWRSICKALDIDMEMYATPGAPDVRIKLEGLHDGS